MNSVWKGRLQDVKDKVPTECAFCLPQLGGLGLQHPLGNLITQGSVECLLSETDTSRHKPLLLFSEASEEMVRRHFVEK